MDAPCRRQIIDDIPWHWPRQGALAKCHFGALGQGAAILVLCGYNDMKIG
jgi:hypothetical protein